MLAVACNRRDLRQQTLMPPSLLALKTKRNPKKTALHAPCRVPEECRSKLKKPMCRQTLASAARGDLKVALSCSRLPSCFRLPHSAYRVIYDSKFTCTNIYEAATLNVPRTRDRLASNTPTQWQSRAVEKRSRHRPASALNVTRQPHDR
jgi:hypothetical protein